MPQLHRHGVELVVDLLDAADHVEKLSTEDIRALLREAAVVLGDLLKRNKPVKVTRMNSAVFIPCRFR